VLDLKLKILVTGGAGYIGSHTILELLAAGHEVLSIDNLSNGHEEAIRRVRRLSNCPLEFEVGDVRDRQFLDRVFSNFVPDAVIHFAGLKAVGESVANPMAYYDVNVTGTSTLLQAMDHVGCRQIIFSSSATVYGEPEYLPLNEAHPTNPLNPYGRTKLMAEQIIADWCAADRTRAAVSLRYFNPVGAHVSGQIGEDPYGIPNNLMPYVAQVAIGRLPKLQIFGGDYDTRDGTGERDYIHVVDLARAHATSIDYLTTAQSHDVINIGTGRGVTVLELVEAFERVSGAKVPRAAMPRRAGDAATYYADASRARYWLGWEAQYGLDDMCRDTWAWQSRNQDGYL
jgi:UDP-glucose 4-epimerase